ncbi:NACHT domain-containing protein [Kitasatospora sp. NPDC127111]|uniref:NACHT domain-containing protein n=1 Tax=Kitasatospora sp. NPDC127111 TaxID=3345363 RepID=UPI0036258EE2
MDYNYESLLNQRFQMLCQSLLVIDYPGVQCFPVGMADGGRDATARTSGHADIVFQVKFTAKPSSIKNPVKWITDSIEGELEKIKRLQERGVTRYFLVTNLAASANLDTGTIDKVDRYLREHVPIDAQCWWRDDLDRRLDSNYDLKLRYPSLLSGADLLRLMIERMGPEENRRRRHRALNSYFAQQFEQDSSIRFKQADLLPSSLFNLFVDVPAAPTLSPDRDNDDTIGCYVEAVNRRVRFDERQPDARAAVSTSAVYRALRGDTTDNLPQRHYSLGELRSPLIGGADLLLDAEFIDDFPQIVLEGAPGQGKSTLAQYIAQVHRARLLQHTDTKLPSWHASSAVMMPFKIELRDLASWLNGFDPWSGKAGTPHQGKKSLEGALAAHVERYSGGLDFSVSDVAFIVEEYPVLIILDALDEVADLEDRNKVVEEVTAATARLSHNARRVRFLATSRPTAVSNAPAFSRQRFQHLKLAAITQEIALEYATRWGKARNLKEFDIAEIRDILSQKMSAPHMAELAKNTMQLSILLSLIYHKGSSLPDKRTELYDAYIDSFFNREVEKSPIVRENRNLLISIHQHLAFYIHARAEGKRTTGRIDRDDLHAVIRNRLRVLRQPENLLDDLLTGVERVVALVSRVEGTFEFEVQPLREYFAARYLYDTAPYISATQSASGTKPDRFEAIAPNPYWLNVTRFFAGCFTMGELLDLAERVSTLCKKPQSHGLNYPRVLALSLLQDWVFFQSVPATERLIDSLFDRAGIRWAERRTRGFSVGIFDESDVDVFLVDKAGGSYLVDKLWHIIESEGPSERVRAACEIIRRQNSNESIAVSKLWARGFEAKKSIFEKSHWITIGGWLGVYSEIPIESLDQDENVLLELLPSLVESGGSFDSCDTEIRRMAAEYVLSDPVAAKPSGLLNRLSFIVNPTVWTMYVLGRSSVSVLRFLESVLGDSHPEERREPYPAISRLAAQMLQMGMPESENSLAPWRGFLEILEGEFGETWAGLCIGIVSGAVRAPQERGAGADRLFDSKFPFIDRVRNAKRRGKQSAWWSTQLTAAVSGQEKLTAIATAYAWAEAETIAEIWPLIQFTVESLDIGDFDRLCRFVRIIPQFSPRSRKSISLAPGIKIFASTGSRMQALFFERLEPGSEKDAFILRAGKMSDNPKMAGLCIDYAWERYLAGAISDSDFISVVDRQYSPGVFPFAAGPRSHFKIGRAMRPLAERVLERPWDMPSDILMMTEIYFSRRSKSVKPVLRIAEEQNWF